MNTLKNRILNPINRVLRWILKYFRIRYYRSKLKAVKKFNPDLYKPIDKTIEKQHTQFWSQIHHSIDLSFLRVYSNYSGLYTPFYIPGDIFNAIVERILNDANTANYDMDKNRLDLILGKENCPRVFLKNTYGDFLDENSLNVTKDQAKSIFDAISSDIIIKPSVYSFQGANVRRFNYKNGKFTDNENKHVDFEFICNLYRSDFIIQECIKQHASTARFNTDSVNCIRVNTYRSVKTEIIHVLNLFFKAGRKGIIVDNTLPGGLWTHINEEGRLGEIAFTKKHQKFTTHPDSGIRLKDQEIPYLERVRELAINAARKFYDHRILGIDIAIKEDGLPIVIEVNSLGIGSTQHVGGPLFREFTDEVIEFCKANRKKNSFNVARI